MFVMEQSYEPWSNSLKGIIFGLYGILVKGLLGCIYIRSFYHGSYEHNPTNGCCVRGAYDSPIWLFL